MGLAIWTALTQNSAETGPTADDPRLGGRTYHIPFAVVWDTILEMIRARRRWRLVYADEASGVIKAEARTRILRFIDEVRVRVSLDDNALTRVDMRSRSRKGRGDLGVNARRIARFFTELDRNLGA